MAKSKRSVSKPKGDSSGMKSVLHWPKLGSTRVLKVTKPKH